MKCFCCPQKDASVVPWDSLSPDDQIFLRDKYPDAGQGSGVRGKGSALQSKPMLKEKRFLHDHDVCLKKMHERGGVTKTTPPPLRESRIPPTGIPYSPYSPEQWPVQWPPAPTPTPPQQGVPGYGGLKGSKTKNSLGDHFLS